MPSIAGLEEWLEEMGLEQHLEDVLEWCQENQVKLLKHIKVRSFAMFREKHGIVEWRIGVLQLHGVYLGRDMTLGSPQSLYQCAIVTTFWIAHIGMIINPLRAIAIRQPKKDLHFGMDDNSQYYHLQLTMALKCT